MGMFSDESLRAVSIDFARLPQAEAPSAPRNGSFPRIFDTVYRSDLHKYHRVVFQGSSTGAEAVDSGVSSRMAARLPASVIVGPRMPNPSLPPK